MSSRHSTSQATVLARRKPGRRNFGKQTLFDEIIFRDAAGGKNTWPIKRHSIKESFDTPSKSSPKRPKHSPLLTPRLKPLTAAFGRFCTEDTGAGYTYNMQTTIDTIHMAAAKQEIEEEEMTKT